MANRSISISLEEGLLARLDALCANRSALVSEALRQWMARRRIESLDTAYAHLATLEAGDLGAAGEDAVAMGLQALARGIASPQHGVRAAGNPLAFPLAPTLISCRALWVGSRRRKWPLLLLV